jgi:predicted RNA methylase
MVQQSVAEAKESFVRDHGKWTAASIHLGNDVYTFDPPQVDTRLRRVLQCAADVVGGSLEKTTVLDLACLEAQFGIELALHGARVTAIEGRPTNIAKCEFVKDILSLDNITFLQDDVRNLSVEKYGHHDIVLCLGILYHMDTPDAMELIKSAFDVCTRAVIFETHVSPAPDEVFTWNGKTYSGSYYPEHGSSDWEEQKDKVWSSIGNTRSFKFTLASLCNILHHVGFSSVHHCLNPYEYHNADWPEKPMGDRHVVEKDRVTLTAIKGRSQALLSSPITENSPEVDRPEYEKYQGDLPQPGRGGSEGANGRKHLASRLLRRLRARL